MHHLPGDAAGCITGREFAYMARHTAKHDALLAGLKEDVARELEGASPSSFSGCWHDV